MCPLVDRFDHIRIFGGQVLVDKKLALDKIDVAGGAGDLFHRTNGQETRRTPTWRANCRNMNSAIIKQGSARDLKVDGCGDKRFRQIQALSMRGNTLLLFGDLNPPGVL